MRFQFRPAVAPHQSLMASRQPKRAFSALSRLSRLRRPCSLLFGASLRSMPPARQAVALQQQGGRQSRCEQPAIASFGNKTFLSFASFTRIPTQQLHTATAGRPANKFDRVSEGGSGSAEPHRRVTRSHKIGRKLTTTSVARAKTYWAEMSVH